MVRFPVFPQKQKELPRVAPFCFYDRQRGTRGFVTAKRFGSEADPPFRVSGFHGLIVDELNKRKHPDGTKKDSSINVSTI